MNNLIMNSMWCPDDKGTLMYFSGQGPSTYDEFCVEGNRTCSITMTKKGTRASNKYDIPIEVCGQHELMFGYCMRAINADNIYLRVDFYDENNRIMDSCKKDITASVSADFTNQMARFPIPHNAKCAKLSLRFEDRVTACTYCAPFAYFC